MYPKEGEGGGQGGGEGGGGFWQTVINYFGSCGGAGDEGGEGGGELVRKVIIRKAIIPPPVEIKVPERESEKLGATETEKVEVDELKPSKPFYFVLPPSPNQLYNYPQTNFIGRPNTFNPFYFKQPLPHDYKLKSDTSVESRGEAVEDPREIAN